MSSPDTPTAEARRIPWLIIVAVAIVVLLVASRFGGGETASSKYARLNQEAFDLSKSALAAWEAHEPLTDTDKANLEKASARVEEMLRIEPTSWQAHAVAAQNYAALEEWDRAIIHIEFDLRNLPPNMTMGDIATMGQLHYLDSEALFFRGHSEEAEKAANYALAIDKAPNYYYARAQARAQQHKLEAAEDDLREMMKIAPDDSRALSLLKFISNMK